jgi:hypothetical protein
MNRKIFDLNSSDTFRHYEWDIYFEYPYRSGKEAAVWPKWLTCPEHYRERGIDWSSDKDFVHYLRQEGYAMSERPVMVMGEPEVGRMATSESNLREDKAKPEETFELSVRDTNNLVRYLYTGGWISHDHHADIHAMLDEMIPWLEQRGIKVDMNMKRM